MNQVLNKWNALTAVAAISAADRLPLAVLVRPEVFQVWLDGKSTEESVGITAVANACTLSLYFRNHGYPMTVGQTGLYDDETGSRIKTPTWMGHFISLIDQGDCCDMAVAEPITPARAHTVFERAVRLSEREHK